MKELDLTIYRHTFNTEGDRAVIGDLHAEGKYFCYTLEDELRADGVKVYGETCIDAGRYKYIVTMSPKFKRRMIAILNVPRFTGIRVHGGNRAKNTLGCPLVAFNTDYVKIWGTAEKELLALVDKHGGEGYINIINAPLSYDKENHKPTI
jgi:hypothetical protein